MPGIFVKSNVPGIFVAMNDSTRNMRPRGKRSKRHGTGPIAFFVSLFIIALGAIQLVSTFHTYALNLAQLNDLKNQEAALITKKQDLENDIERWNDDSYVATQARERLGFVFPGEKAVRVQHPEAVTGTSEGTTKTKAVHPTGRCCPGTASSNIRSRKPMSGHRKRPPAANRAIPAKPTATPAAQPTRTRATSSRRGRRQRHSSDCISHSTSYSISHSIRSQAGDRTRITRRIHHTRCRETRRPIHAAACR